MVDEVMRFDQIAPLLDLDESTLARLTPCTAWTLFLPQKNIGQSCCPDGDPGIFSLPRQHALIEPERTPEIVFVPDVTYRVKSGDVLGKIADRYGVSVRQLREWNDLSGP